MKHHRKDDAAPGLPVGMLGGRDTSKLAFALAGDTSGHGISKLALVLAGGAPANDALNKKIANLANAVGSLVLDKVLADLADEAASLDEAIASADEVIDFTWKHIGLKGDPPGALEFLGERIASVASRATCRSRGSPWHEGMLKRVGDQATMKACDGLLKQYDKWQEQHETPSFVEALRAWFIRPRKVAPDTRQDKLILPVIADGPQAGDMMATLIAAEHETPLPLPPGPGEAVSRFAGPGRKEVVLLNLVDAATGQPVRTQGQGAPLEARLLVSVLRAVPQKDRAGRVLIELTLRDLVDAVHAGKWNRGKQWPALRQALEGLGRIGFVMPRRGSIWRPVIVRGPLPAIDAPLDTPVAFVVALPPGSESGPAIDPTALAELGVKSGPKWRAFIAAHSLTWKPGVTRVPAKVKGQYTWTRKEAAYPVLTDGERRWLAFGDAAMNRTTDQLDAPWQDIPGLVRLEGQDDPKTGAAGVRFLPDQMVEWLTAPGGK